MKIIIVANYGGEGNNFTSGALNDKELAWLSKADSTLLRGGKPYFLPEGDDVYMAHAYVVARLCRLGKSIPSRFAYRYLDGWTIGLNIWNESKKQRLQAAGLPWDSAFDMDYSSVLGDVVRMVPTRFASTGTDEEGSSSSPFDFIEVSVQIQPDETADFTDVAQIKLGGLMNVLTNEIEKLSVGVTVRQGDYLFALPLGQPFRIALGQRIKGFSNGSLLLDTSVK